MNLCSKENISTCKLCWGMPRKIMFSSVNVWEGGKEMRKERVKCVGLFGKMNSMIQWRGFYFFLYTEYFKLHNYRSQGTRYLNPSGTFVWLPHFQRKSEAYFGFCSHSSLSHHPNWVDMLDKVNPSTMEIRLWQHKTLCKALYMLWNQMFPFFSPRRNWKGTEIKSGLTLSFYFEQRF